MNKDEIRKEDVERMHARILSTCAELGYGHTVDVSARGWAALGRPGADKDFVSGWLRLLADQVEFNDYRCGDCRTLNPNQHELGCEVGGPKERYKPRDFNDKLGYLVEECGEVIAVLGKTLRWGLSSTNPELPPEKQETNRDWLLRELNNLQAAMRFVRDAPQMSPPGPARQEGDKP